MRLGYELTIEQTQKLAMTPELIQAIKILQLNNLDLSLYIQKELIENPVLEEIPERQEDIKETIDIRDRIVEEEYDEASFRRWENSPENDKRDFERYAVQEETLSDFLLEQLKISGLPETEMRTGRVIIGAIDENGYLTVNLREIAILASVDVPVAESVLEYIQTMDPPGVGARSLSECLMIQLRQKGDVSPEVEHIVNYMLQDIADNRIAHIAKTVGLSNREVQHIIDRIRTLEPKPGRQFAGSESTGYIVPDIIVENIDGEYVISTNDGSVPKLKVSSYYSQLASQAKEDENLNKYLTSRFNSAMWLIRSIEQRKQTIMNVATSIVHFQKDYFDKGEKYIKPLTLKQIADELGIHESTVSRAIKGKYMQSPRGVCELKFFFSSGVQSHSGEGVSSNSVKSIIRDIVSREDQARPYSDQEIVALLKDKDIDISRRTVAKYREAMGIPSSSKRKRY